MRKCFKKKALVAGTFNLDIVPVFEDDCVETQPIIREGKSIYLNGIKYMLGGVVANTGILMKKLGADVTLVCRVGDDYSGMVASKILEESKAVVKVIKRKEEVSSTTVVVSAKGMDRCFWYKPGASQNFEFSDVELLIQHQDLFHFGYPTSMKCMYENDGVLLAEMYQKIKGMGITTSLDLSLPGTNSEASKANWKVILQKTLPYVDVFLPSLEEILFMIKPLEYNFWMERMEKKNFYDSDDWGMIEGLLRDLLDMGVKVAGIKLGKMGMMIMTAEQEKFEKIGRIKDALDDSWYGKELLEVPYLPEKFYSTSGTGDAAICGFLTAMLFGEKLEDALKLASATAATRIESQNGINDVPVRDEIEKRIQNKWDKINVLPNERIWGFDSKMKCYVKVKN